MASPPALVPFCVAAGIHDCVYTAVSTGVPYEQRRHVQGRWRALCASCDFSLRARRNACNDSQFGVSPCCIRILSSPPGVVAACSSLASKQFLRLRLLRTIFIFPYKIIKCY